MHLVMAGDDGNEIRGRGMSEMVLEAVYKEFFPFWEKISARDRDVIC